MRPYETRKSYKYDQFSPYRLVSSWLPGEGISREVIQADIRRYLGSEATIIPSERDVSYKACAASISGLTMFRALMVII